MKTNKILAITLSLPLSFCPISCSNSLPKKIDMSSYSISKGSILYNQKLCRISTSIIDSQGFSGISFKTPDWSFSTMTVFFKSDCALNRDELYTFATRFDSEAQFDEEPYSCLGTDLYSYSTKTTNSLGETEFSYVPKQTDKDIAAYYIGNLVEYNIKREDGSTFEVYVLISGTFVTVLNVD